MEPFGGHFGSQNRSGKGVNNKLICGRGLRWAWAAGPPGSPPETCCFDHHRDTQRGRNEGLATGPAPPAGFHALGPTLPAAHGGCAAHHKQVGSPGLAPVGLRAALDRGRRRRERHMTLCRASWWQRRHRRGFRCTARQFMDDQHPIQNVPDLVGLGCGALNPQLRRHLHTTRTSDLEER